jgi:hypothetical protein
MTQDKTEQHVMFASTILLMLFTGLALFVASIVQASPGPDSAASVATFRAKCAMCHGPDGSGSEVGKSMNVPDLRSPEVQKLPDAQLAQIISDGKGGDAILQEFAQRRPGSFPGSPRSIAAWEKIIRPRV